MEDDGNEEGRANEVEEGPVADVFVNKAVDGGFGEQPLSPRKVIKDSTAVED